MSSRPGPSAGQVALALGSVYLIWGSTYLAIRFGIETIPPFVLIGVRLLLAGGILYLASARGVPPPTLRHWLAAAAVGTLLLVVGNGGVAWAEQTVPSGLTAVLVSMTPVWMVLIHWATGGSRPTALIALALVLGLAGVVVLAGPADLAGGGRVDPVGAAVLMLASFCWGAGSIYSRHAPVPARPIQATAMQQLSAGAILVVLAAVTGQWAHFSAAAVSLRSAGALAYLVLIGSLVGFTAYIWLTRNAAPALVSTYAYVNPVVAVFLGWALAGEPLTPRTFVAAAVIVAAVVIVTTEQARGAVRARRAALEDEPEGTIAD